MYLSSDNLLEIEKFNAWKEQKSIDESILGAIGKGVKIAATVAPALIKGAATIAKGASNVGSDLQWGFDSRQTQLDAIKNDPTLTPDEIKSRKAAANLAPAQALSGGLQRTQRSLMGTLNATKNKVKNIIGAPQPTDSLLKRVGRSAAGAMYDTLKYNIKNAHELATTNKPDQRNVFAKNFVSRLRSNIGRNIGAPVVAAATAIGGQNASAAQSPRPVPQQGMAFPDNTPQLTAQQTANYANIAQRAAERNQQLKPIFMQKRWDRAITAAKQDISVKRQNLGSIGNPFASQTRAVASSMTGNPFSGSNLNPSTTGLNRPSYISMRRRLEEQKNFINNFRKNRHK